MWHIAAQPGAARCAAITAALNENPGLGKERISVLLFPWESLERAQQMFTDLNRTLSILYDANEELIGSKLEKSDTKEYKDKLAQAISYWKAVSRAIPDWEKVKGGTMKAPMLRQEKINTHGVVLRALGGLGRALIEAYPSNWEVKLEALREIDWRKSVGNKVNPE